MIYAHINCAEISRGAIESTETLMEQAKEQIKEQVRVADKLDEMSTESNESGVMKVVGEIISRAETLPAT